MFKLFWKSRFNFIKIRKPLRILDYNFCGCHNDRIFRFQIIKDQRNIGFTDFENCQIFLRKFKYFDPLIWREIVTWSVTRILHRWHHGVWEIKTWSLWYWKSNTAKANWGKSHDSVYIKFGIRCGFYYFRLVHSSPQCIVKFNITRSSIISFSNEKFQKFIYKNKLDLDIVKSRDP